MSSRIVAIAEALKDRVNVIAVEQSFAFVAQRRWYPIRSVSAGDLEDLAVSVVPVTWRQELITRGAALKRRNFVDVYMQQEPGDDEANIDPIMQIAEKLASEIGGKELPNVEPGTVCTEVTVPLLIDPDHMEKYDVCTCIVRFTFT